MTLTERVGTLQNTAMLCAITFDKPIESSSVEPRLWRCVLVSALASKGVGFEDIWAHYSPHQGAYGCFHLGLDLITERPLLKITQ